jgi:hypothetical protein
MFLAGKNSPISSEKNLQKYFSDIYLLNSFQGKDSKSGPGSDLTQTTTIRKQLPQLLKDLNIMSFCDIPCGDFNWMNLLSMDPINYTGHDIAPELINNLKIEFESDYRKFSVLNLVNQIPSKYDLIFCRDLLVHLSFSDALLALENIKKSESTYLLTTSFPKHDSNQDIEYSPQNIGWYPINLELTPFNFPTPILIVNENCTEGDGLFADKSLVLYAIKDL